MIYDLLDQIQTCIKNQQFYVALFTALTIPDIAGAVDSKDGTANKEGYIDWFDKYVSSKFYCFGKQYITGEDCYYYRCVMLHQGKQHHKKHKYSKTIFLYPKQNNIAYCGVFTIENGNTVCIDVCKFCGHIMQSCYEWLGKVEETELFIKNTSDLINLFTLSFDK